MKIFDSLEKKLVKFEVRPADEVGIYLCGPTVYDLPHLGHGRSAVNFDFLRKYLKLKGYKVKFVSNYTDIDDKMIKRAAEMNISVKELADKIIPEYCFDYDNLRVETADFSPKATDHVGKMITMVMNLAKHDIAYKLSDGWYFDIKKFPDYGRLSGQSLEEQKAGARIELVEGKRNPQDFVLWKLKKEGEPSWQSDFLGDGRPGWHIECSAMINEVFHGKTIEIHGGGEDLRFPHHDCEIAQSKCCFGGDFVRYWMHNAFVMVNSEKMSKSLNNFTTLRDLFKIVDPLVVRFFYLQHHYRSPIDFHDQALEQAKNGLFRLHNFYNNLKTAALDKVDETDLSAKLAVYDQKIVTELDNDLETGKALSVLYDLVFQANGYLEKNLLSLKDRLNIMNFWSKWNSVFGFLMPTFDGFRVSEMAEESDLNDLDNLIADFDGDEKDIALIVAIRLLARSKKDFAISDKVRDFLASKKIILEDSKEGTIVKFQ